MSVNENILFEASGRKLLRTSTRTATCSFSIASMGSWFTRPGSRAPIGATSTRRMAKSPCAKYRRQRANGFARGRVLWRFQTGSGIHGSPISFAVNGKQYIAVPSGWGGWMKGFAPQLYGAARGNALFVFTSPEKP